VQPSEVKEEDIDGTAMDDVDGVPLEEIDGTPLDSEQTKDKTNDDDINGVPIKSIVPYGDDIDGEPGIAATSSCLLYYIHGLPYTNNCYASRFCQCHLLNVEVVSELVSFCSVE